MALVPDSKLGKIQFYETHLAAWTANSVAIGSSAPAIADLTTKITAARTAFNAQETAKEAAEAATLNCNTAVDALAIAGADVISSIRTKARTTGDSVYVLAQIPAPATPTPVGPLGKPSDFKVTLEETGALNLTWKCTNPPSAGGTFYTVWRRIGAAGAFVCIGGNGAKKFTDATLPAGTASVTYQLQATRSTSVGPWAQFVVNFGVASGETTIASITESQPTKIAA